MVEELSKMNETTLESQDGWGYRIVCYEDVTVIKYFESLEGKEKELFQITSGGYDIQLFEAALKTRKHFEELNK